MSSKIAAFIAEHLEEFEKCKILSLYFHASGGTCNLAG
jgi:hypothetical protein